MSEGCPGQVSTQGHDARPAGGEPRRRLPETPPHQGAEASVLWARDSLPLRLWKSHCVGGLTTERHLFCPSSAAVDRPGARAGQGSAAGSKATARTTWAGDSVLPAAAAARRALGLVARRAAHSGEPDARSRHGHQDGRVAGGRPGRQRPGARLAGRRQGATERGR